MSVLQQVTRDQSQVHLPDVINTGVTATTSTGEVWGWVRLTGRSTDDIPTGALYRMTDRDAGALAGLIPPGHDFHLKIQFSRYSGAAYLTERWADTLTEGQQAHLAICADCIDQNDLPDRFVLLGVRFDAAGRQGDNEGVVAKLTRKVAAARNPMKDGQAALAAAETRVASWIADMVASDLGAAPATITELAWSLARDMQGTPTWLPGDEDFVGPRQVARLAPVHVTPADDHILLRAHRQDDRYLRILVPTTGPGGGFPTQDLALPGGEWLKNLFIAATDQDRNAPPVEVSIRGTNLTRNDALGKLRGALKTAREQQEEATSQGAVVPLLVESASTGLEHRIQDVQGQRCDMVKDTPTWVVEAPTLDLLNTRTRQVIQYYRGMGIELWQGHCIQDLLYKQLLLGDRVRVPEFEQLRPWQTLTGGWGHGGSNVGSTAPTSHYLGVNVGSTPMPFQLRLTDASQEGRGGHTAATGTTGAGKSTAVCLTAVMEAVWGAWVLLTDFKGDLRGAPQAARLFGVRVTEISTDQVAAGALCPFRYVPDVQEAASMVVDFLMMLFRDPPLHAERVLRRAANTVSQRNRLGRSTYQVIQLLQESGDPQAREIGEELAGMADDPLARPVAGDPGKTTQSLPTGPGLVYLRFADLRWPGSRTPRGQWSAGNRLSMLLVQAGFAYATYMAGRVKGIPKLVALTELHLLTCYDFGQDFVGRIAKLGRALDVVEILDTQESAELEQIHGLLDQINTVLAFHVTRQAEAEAQARLMGLEPDAGFVAAQTRPLRKGERDCLVRDRDGNIGRVSFDYLTEEIRDLLNTTPDRHAPVIEAEPEEDVA